jgi:hypothetical protein
LTGQAFQPGVRKAAKTISLDVSSGAVHHFSDLKNGVKLALDHNVSAQPRFQGNETRTRAVHHVSKSKMVQNCFSTIKSDRLWFLQKSRVLIGLALPDLLNVQSAKRKGSEAGIAIASSASQE